jgi:hypothetical protein
MFLHLETEAAPAIPLIEQKLQKLPPSNAAQMLGRALLSMGYAGGIALSDCVTNTNIALTNRVFLIKMLEMRSRGSRSPDVEYNLAALTNCLADPSPQIRQAAQAAVKPLPPPLRHYITQ